MAKTAPYMPLYIADYMADTAHLTALEHGAYLMLLMNYWQTQKPLSNNPRKLAAIARVSADEWPEVWEMLEEYFTEDGAVFRHKRVDAELAELEAKFKRAAEGGKKGAEKRWGKQRVNSPPIADLMGVPSKTISKTIAIREGKEREERTLGSLRSPKAGSDDPAPTPENTDSEIEPEKPKPVDFGKQLFDEAVRLLEGKPMPDSGKVCSAAQARSLAGKLKKANAGSPWAALQAVVAAKTAADPVQYVLGAIHEAPRQTTGPPHDMAPIRDFLAKDQARADAQKAKARNRSKAQERRYADC